MKSFIERTRREIERREQKKPKRHLGIAVFCLLMSFALIMWASVGLTSFEVPVQLILSHDGYAVLFISGLAVGMAFCYMQSVATEIEQYFYLRRIRKYERLCRAEQLAADDSDIFAH